jgi:hypothetical protein
MHMIFRKAAPPGPLFILALGVLLLVPAPLLSGDGGRRGGVDVSRARLGPSGSNRYFPMTPGLRQTYRGRTTTLIRTVLDETKELDGVRTRVVEDREERHGQPVEVSRDYYALDALTNDVYYFGEEVANYHAGELVSHEGTWLAGQAGATFGLALAGQPRVGETFDEERAPGVAMDQGEITGIDETVTTPAGTFHHCVHVRETSPLEKGAVDHKWFAPGFGMVRDDDLVLVKIERPRP